MVAETWILKMGNQMSDSLKHASVLENSKKSSSKKQGQQEKQIIGILSFEVANVMSKIIHLHKSLTDVEIVKLQNEILKSEGIKALVTNDESMLLEIALVEKLDDLNRVASVVSRLGKKCTIPVLQGFEHVYLDLVSGLIEVKELGFLVKDMESMIKKMERFVGSTARLYSEIEVMNELEVATKKFQQNQHEESRKAFEQKLMWQKQDVRHLKDVSLWNRTYDKVVELLARSVCTVYVRICITFGDAILKKDILNASVSRSQFNFGGSLQRLKQESGHKSCHLDLDRAVQTNASSTKSFSAKSSGYGHSVPIEKGQSEERRVNFRPQVELHKSEGGLSGPEAFNFTCGMGPGRMFMECLNMSNSTLKVDDDDYVSHIDRSSQISGRCSVSSGVKREQLNLSGYSICSLNSDPFGDNQRPGKSGSLNGVRFGPKSRLMAYAPPSTVGGSALALHYANVIIVIEKLLRHPHLVGEEARDDLYQMLPASLRKTLKIKLKSYVKDLAIYDAPLAHDWKERLNEMLKWLAPLAHNMIRWQSERNFEQHQIVTKTNVLLIQTLYFADREKMEVAICEILVGLNYICRYENQQNALLDCASSFDFEDCMEWQLQLGSSVYHQF
ncbi:uncharacterized protein LOC111379133 [Olea europaea var. sylvestris]|uniref:uncharacterized protein LOC111379133 n=1 Tax=Olea europaea var. sylvestris TaxID=158386 RepID=UPI000C1D39ED|nr:uncharacterized protein LOC111379133 [Olea europaea var. sylvestris]